MVGDDAGVPFRAVFPHTVLRLEVDIEDAEALLLTLPRLKPWDSEVLVRAQSISVLLKPSDEGVPSPLLRQTI